MNGLVNRLKQEGQDFEWYPTTDLMLRAVKACLPEDAKSILDIGAGDGRALKSFLQKCKDAKLYGIELSPILMQQWLAIIIPVGTDLFEQRLASLQMEFIFCNPPYSEYEDWVVKIIDEGFAKRAYIVIPARWKESGRIAQALKSRGATTSSVFLGDFSNAERQARAVIEIIEIRFPRDNHRYDSVLDPFDIWFEANVGTFDKETKPDKWEAGEALAKKLSDASIDEMVAHYDVEYKILIDNYQLIFKLDYMVLHELGINKNAVREGLKTKMVGLKVLYWQLLFDRLDAITSRLTTKSKKNMLDKLNSNMSVNFTVGNCYAVVIWAIKNSNHYFEQQAIELFYALSTFDGVLNYKSNQRTWEKTGWRYNSRDDKYTHYKLDYRIVLQQSYAIDKEGRQFVRDGGSSDCPGGLSNTCHDVLADIKAVLSNLGLTTFSTPSKQRTWCSGQWQDWYQSNSDNVLFQAKAYMNGNMHFRFMPDAIMALNVYVARSLKWVHTVNDVIEDMEVPVELAKKYFDHNPEIDMHSVKLLKG